MIISEKTYFKFNNQKNSKNAKKGATSNFLKTCKQFFKKKLEINNLLSYEFSLSGNLLLSRRAIGIPIIPPITTCAILAGTSAKAAAKPH